MTDTERIDWLEAQFGCALVNDDNAHWTVAFDGMQNVPEGEGPCDIATSFFIEADRWANSVREAIDAAIEAEVTA